MDSSYELIIKVGREKVRIDTQGGVEKTADFKINELTERILNIFEDWLRKGKITEDEELAVLGTILYEAIFVDEVKEHFERRLAENEQNRKSLQKSDERLRIALSFDKEAAKWARLPWEFLYYPKENLPLATKTSLVLLRHTPTEDAPEQLAPPVETLKVMIVVVQPDELIRDSISRDITKYKTDFDSISKEIQQRLKDSPKLAKVNVLDELRNPTIAEFASALNHHNPHVVHYIGYGRYLGEGEIAFLHTGKETAEWVKKSAFADCFQGLAPRLVFLQLCEGPQKELDGSNYYLKANFAELAPELILKHVPAIIAMRYPVDPEVAKRFTETFYKTLAEGKSIATAVQEGRRWSTISGAKMHIGSPVLFMHSHEGLLLPLTEVSETGGAQSSTSSSLGPASTVSAPASQTLSEAAPPEFSFEELALVGFEAADSVSLKGVEVNKEMEKLRKLFNQDVDLARLKIKEKAQELSLTDPTGQWTTVFVTLAKHFKLHTR